MKLGDMEAILLQSSSS